MWCVTWSNNSGDVLKTEHVVLVITRPSAWQWWGNLLGVVLLWWGVSPSLRWPWDGQWRWIVWRVTRHFCSGSSLTLAAFRLEPAPLHYEMNNWCGTIHLLHGQGSQSNSVMAWISAQFCIKKAGVTLPSSDCRVVCCSCTSCCWASLSPLMEYLLELSQYDSMTACMVTPDSVITAEQQTQYLMLSCRPRDSH